LGGEWRVQVSRGKRLPGCVAGAFAAVAVHDASKNKVGRDEPPGGPGTGASIYMRSDRGDLSNLLTTG